MFWWPHGGHGERARARAGYGARRWAHGRPGRASAERFAALQRHQEAKKALAPKDSLQHAFGEALNPVRLAQRASPMLKMLKHCLADPADMVWGV